MNAEAEGAAGVAALFEGLFGPRVALSLWTGSGVPELLPDEAAAVDRAVTKRRIEFARGRGCARGALGALGQSPVAIPVGVGRQPLWPPGFVGSIAHHGGIAVAVAALEEHVDALGVDLEGATTLGYDVARLIATEHEFEQLGQAKYPDTLAFSAKESVFKAVFPGYGDWIDFLQVVVDFDIAGSRFTVRAVDRTLPEGLLDGLHGVFAVDEHHVATGVFRTSAGP